jgi:hypothetical protein
VPRLAPEDVAEAIVETLRRPRFDVFVPRSIGPLTVAGWLLPRRVRELLHRAIRADRVLADVDSSARRGYELRAARSEPALPPAAEVPQLSEAAGR